MNVVDRLGVEGSFIFHSFPSETTVDPAVWNLFKGFHKAPDRTAEWLSEVFGEGAKAKILVGDEVREVDLIDAVGAELFAVQPQPSTRPYGIAGLVWVVDHLLGPEGCPWDRAQTHESLTKYLVEETYELVDAIGLSDDQAMREELGDVLLQVVMHSQMKALAGHWDFQSVAELNATKLVRRHPHVFGEATATNPEEVLRVWNAEKAREKPRASVLDGVPRSMPALARAMSVSQRAAGLGFEWPDLEAVWEKVEEEINEVKAAKEAGDLSEITDEIGDLLFTVVNVARWLKVDPEEALRKMVDRFQRRFMAMEAAADVPLDQLSAQDWDRLWTLAKANLHQPS